MHIGDMQGFRPAQQSLGPPIGAGYNQVVAGEIEILNVGRVEGQKLAVVLLSPPGIFKFQMLDNLVVAEIGIDDLFFGYHGIDVGIGKEGGYLVGDNFSASELVEEISDYGCLQGMRLL